MTEEQLNQHIDEILPEINKDKLLGVPFSSQIYFNQKGIDSGDEDYIVDKLVEFGLVRRSPKSLSELILENFGQDVLRDGGWLIYLEREKRKQIAHRTEGLKSDRLVKTQSKVNTISSAVSALAAVAALTISIETMNKSDGQTEKKDREIAELKSELNALSSQIQNINVLIDKSKDSLPARWPKVDSTEFHIKDANQRVIK